MPRRRRVMIEGGLYHVYNRFARGEEVFGDPEEGKRFVDRLRDTKDRGGFLVFAWCVMSNHFHLALRSSAVPLSRSMHFLQNGFSRDFNRRWRRTGPLWQSRYQAKLIDEQDYLSGVITYIHLNPVRAGLVNDPSKYTLSGHRDLMGKIRSPLCDVNEALSCFGATVKSARLAYASNLKHAMKEDGLGGEIGSLPWWGRDQELDLDENRPYVDVSGRSTGLERPRLRAEQFVTLACELLDIDVSQIASSRQDSATGRVRRMIASCGIERWEQRAGELAVIFRKHSVVLSRWASEARRLCREDEAFAAEVEALDQALSEAALERIHELRDKTQES